MRSPLSSPAFLSTFSLLAFMTGCDGCGSEPTLSERERTLALASAIQAPASSSRSPAGPGIGHAANVVPGQGPERLAATSQRTGPMLPMLPGQGLGPIRFGASKETIERLMGAPCDDVTRELCRYVQRAVEFELSAGVVSEIRVSRKGREAKRTAEGSIVEYGFFNGELLPDLYFGMHEQAVQAALGQPQRVEKISPLGPDGLAERHFYDGATLEYDLWSSGKLILGAVILTKSASAAAKNEATLAALEKRASEARATPKKPLPTRPPR